MQASQASHQFRISSSCGAKIQNRAARRSPAYRGFNLDLASTLTPSIRKITRSSEKLIVIEIVVGEAEGGGVVVERARATRGPTIVAILSRSSRAPACCADQPLLRLYTLERTQARGFPSISSTIMLSPLYQSGPALLLPQPRREKSPPPSAPGTTARRGAKAGPPPLRVSLARPLSACPWRTEGGVLRLELHFRSVL